MPLRVYLQLLLATFLWGTAFPAIKYGFDVYHVPPLAFAGARFVFGGLLLLALAALWPSAVKGAQTEGNAGTRCATPDWPRVALIGLLATALFYALFFKGMQLTSASSGAIIDGTSPLVAALMAHHFLRNDRLTLRKLIAFVIAMIGVCGTAFGRSGQGDPVSPVGCMLILAGLTVSSAGTLLVVTYNGSLPLLRLVGTQMTFGGCLLLVASFATEQWSELSGRLDWRFGAILFWLAFVSAVAFLIWYGLMRHYKVVSIAVFSFLIALWGALLSVLFMGDRVTWHLIVGLALVGTGVVLASRDPAGHERQSGDLVVAKTAPGEP